MNTMTYKGYVARIEYDDRDNILIGRICGVRDTISFHGETVPELRAAFEGAVEDYLVECAERGVAPEKPFSGRLLLRIPPEMHGKVLTAARAEGKSLNQWATEVLVRAVQTHG